MILAEAILLGLVGALLTGGSVRRLLHEQLVGEWALLVLLPMQLMWPAVSRRIGFDAGIGIVVWLLMMGGLAIVLFINSPRRWMLAFAGLGIALNVLVIGLNGAMPVSIKATSEIGIPRVAARDAFAVDRLHEEMGSDTRLAALGDVLAVPGPRWQRSVVSVGDVLLVSGLALWLVAASRGTSNGGRG